MKKYDKIYTQPDEEQEPIGSNYALYSNDGDGEGVYLDDLHEANGPLICMTTEELREIWTNAFMRGQEEFAKATGKAYRDLPDFETYLQSKGIDPTK